MTLLYIISILLLAAYIMYAVGVCGVPASLSDTYYQLKKHARPAWLFQAAMIVPPALLLPVWLECSPEGTQHAAFLSCASLMFVGVSPLFKDDRTQRRIHYACTVIAAVFSVMWLFCSGLWQLPVAAFALSVLCTSKFGKGLFWAEVCLLAAVYTGIALVLSQSPTVTY